MNDTPPRFAWDLVGWWTLVFVANLPVPLLGSWGAVLHGYACGVFGGIAMLYLLGAAVCGLRWRVGRSLVGGGALVALTQLFPLLQVFSGIFAMVVWSVVTGSSMFFGGSRPESNDMGGMVKGNFEMCALVFLTAQPLIVCSIFLGAAIRFNHGDRPIWFTRPVDPDAEQSAGDGDAAPDGGVGSP